MAHKFTVHSSCIISSTAGSWSHYCVDIFFFYADLKWSKSERQKKAVINDIMLVAYALSYRRKISGHISETDKPF